MPFEIKNKIALISGGASGIGFRFAKELLRNGLRGVTIADINENLGKQVLKELQEEFGKDRVIYVKTDVTNKQNYEEAFLKTVSVFKNLDILINNAGICKDILYEKEIAVNLNGTINGVLLGLETYIPKYKTGDEGVIVNISSVAGVSSSAPIPIYSATKFGVIGLSKAFGDETHYKRTKVRVLALCPGLTDTPILDGVISGTLGPPYEQLLKSAFEVLSLQKPEYVASAMIEIVKNAKTGTVWVAEDEKKPYEFIFPPRESFAPK